MNKKEVINNKINLNIYNKKSKELQVEDIN